MTELELPWHAEALRAELSRLDQLPHALLLLGTPGIGKTRYARALAAALLCEAPQPDGRACGACDACGWVAAGTHPDLRTLAPAVDDDGKSAREIKVEQVRALGEFLNVGGHRGGRRVVLIDPADAMNTVTANALLKTLEEPGDGLAFVLVSSRPDAIAATIRSRCQVRVLEGPGLDAASAWVQGQTGCSPQEAGTWLAMAGGAPLHATRFAEPGQAAAHRAMLEAVAGLPETGPEAAADALQRADARLWLPLLQRWLMDVGRCRSGAGPRYFPSHAHRLAELARRADEAGIAQAGRGLAAQYRHVEHPLNPRLFCEASIECYLGAFETPTGSTPG
jgi:DNA polymerase-3 subunit delta'